MSEPRQASDMQNLFALARGERASDDARERVRERVLTAAAATAVGATSAGLGTSLWKSAFFGKLLGGVLLLGVVGSGLVFRAQATDERVRGSAVPQDVLATTGGAHTPSVTPRVEAARVSPVPEAPLAAAPTPSAATVAKLAPATVGATRDPKESAVQTSLEHEASLLTEARLALQRGDLTQAQRALTARRALKSRAMDPEALALEVRVLRAQGDADVATAREAELKLRFPNHSLAR